MKAIDYSIKDGKLILRDPSTHCILRCIEYEAKVLQILPLRKTRDCLVLLEPSGTKEPTFENLFRIDIDGEVKWRAELPSTHNCFVAMSDESNRIEARTWNGEVVELDPETGRATNVRFAK